MSTVFATDSVGLVKAQSHTFYEPLELANGKRLPNYTLFYECYGELNHDASNAVLICHALSGSHHAAGYYSESDKKPGWWDSYIGPGKPIDTRHFFVVSVNNIGSCYGSTGPTSINPDTGEIYGPNFPTLRIRDWVNTQKALMQILGISQWAAIIGGSMGGMQVMRWALEYPDLMRHSIVIASSMKLSAQNIAFNETARQAIISDPDFHAGNYAQQQTLPRRGLALARMIGHLTYLSNHAMDVKFGRSLRSGSFQLGQDSPLEFQVESYLRYQGANFAENFDANTYILLTHTLDYFDLAREYNHDPIEAFRHAKSAFMVISFSTDWRFSPLRSQEIATALIAADKKVCYANIQSDFGHDAFLLKDERYESVMRVYMQRIRQEFSDAG